MWTRATRRRLVPFPAKAAGRSQDSFCRTGARFTAALISRRKTALGAPDSAGYLRPSARHFATSVLKWKTAHPALLERRRRRQLFHAGDENSIRLLRLHLAPGH